MSDAVVQLNNMCQGHKKPAPVYETTSEGPDHGRKHTVKVFIEQVEWGRATATNIKEAKKEAAKIALAETQSKWGAY